MAESRRKNLFSCQTITIGVLVVGWKSGARLRQRRWRRRKREGRRYNGKIFLILFISCYRFCTCCECWFNSWKREMAFFRALSSGRLRLDNVKQSGNQAEINFQVFAVRLDDWNRTGRVFFHIHQRRRAIWHRTGKKGENIEDFCEKYVQVCGFFFLSSFILHIVHWQVRLFFPHSRFGFLLSFGEKERRKHVWEWRYACLEFLIW